MTAPLAEAFVRLRVDAADVGPGVKRAFASSAVASTAAKTGKDAGSRFGSSFRRTAGSILAGFGAAYLGREVLRAGKAAVLAAADFQTTGKQIKIATDTGAAGMRNLNQLAIQMGNDTVFSASEAQGAMLDLAKGGLSPAQIQAGALNDSLVLAAAGGLELDTAANTVVKTMGAFRLGAKQTDSAVAALAGAANASSANVSDVTQALSQAGTSAHAAGLTVQETTAILAEFADAGIQGSDAGTSLRTMLTRLVPQTDKARDAFRKYHLDFVDANGDFLDGVDIAEQLQNRLGELTQAERTRALQTLFGADSQRAANILIEQGGEGLAKYLKATSDQTQAQRLANAAMSGAKGSFEQLSGTIDTATLQFGRGLLPVVKDTTDQLNTFIQGGDFRAWGRETGGALQNVGGFLADVGGELRPLAEELLPLLRDNATVAFGVFSASTTGLRLVVDLVGDLPDPLQKIVLALAGLSATGAVGKIRLLGDSFSTFATNVGNAETRSAALGRSLRTGGIAIGLAGVASSLGETNDALSAVEQIGGFAALGFGISGSPIGALIGGAAGAMLQLGKATGLFGDETEEAKPDVAEFTDTLNQLTGAATRSTRALVAQTLEKAGLLQQAPKLGISGATLVDSVLGKPSAIRATQVAFDNALGNASASLDKARSKQTAYYNQIHSQGTPVTAAQNEQLHKLFLRTLDAEGAYGKLKDQVQKFGSSIEANRAQLDNDIAALRRQREAVTGVHLNVDKLRGLLKSLPPAARTEISALGVDATRRDVIDIGNRYKGIDNRTLTSLIQVLGLETARSNVQGLVNALGGLHDKTITVNVNTGAIGHIKDGGLIGARFFDFGGPVSGPGGPRDDKVPAWLSNGEFVVNAAATARHLGLLQAINAQRYAVGGPVDREASRALAADIRHFNVAPSQSAADTREAVRALIAGLRDVVGRGSPLLGRIDRLGDRLFAVQRSQDKLADRYEAERQDLKDLFGQRRQEASAISAAFTHDAFGGNLEDAFLQLRADRNDARTARRRLNRAGRLGLSDAARRALAQSGNLGLISEVDTRREVRQLNALIRQRGASTRQLGRSQAAEIFGDEIHAQRRALHELSRHMRRLNHELERLGDRVERGARAGTGDRDRRTTAQRRPR